MPGITRANVLRVCRDAGIAVRECDFTLTDVYSADEAMVTGTFAGVLPVVRASFGTRLVPLWRRPLSHCVLEV